MPDVTQSLEEIVELLAAREEDFDSLREMQLEWLQFQTTLERLIHLVDGNGRAPISERLLLLEEQTRRLNQMSEQIDAVKLRLIALLVGLTISLVAALFALVRH
jgi:hypothetical protein